MTNISTENETAYLRMLARVAQDGEQRSNRTGIDTRAVYGYQLDLRLHPQFFPLWTTKCVHFHSVMHELLWMLSGESNIEYLRANKVTIWNAWADANYRPEMGYPDGDLGPVYGKQWRAWPGPGGQLIDQVAKIVHTLRENPGDRRNLLCSWNVAQLDEMKLPPCHYAAQFIVDNGGGLICIMSIRSWDLFLGGPFNVAQYALLTHMLAHVTGLVPRRLVINAGDAHLYINHLDAVAEQLERRILNGPRLLLDPDVKEIDDFRPEHIQIDGYNPHPPIRAEVAR
jgi:thymidylate synthase